MRYRHRVLKELMHRQRTYLKSHTTLRGNSELVLRAICRNYLLASRIAEELRHVDREALQDERFGVRLRMGC